MVQKTGLGTDLILLVLDVEPLLPEVVGNVKQLVANAAAERAAAPMVMAATLVRHAEGWVDTAGNTRGQFHVNVNVERVSWPNWLSSYTYLIP
jgi:hypothetical protein